MLIFFLSANTLFVLASAVLGTRLVLLARRTRQLPELLIGCSLLFGGVFSIVFWFLDGFGVFPDPYGELVGFLGRLFTSLAVASVLFLIWRVFYPTSSTVAVLVGYLLALLTANFVREVLPAPATLIVDPLWWGSSFAQAFPYLWLAWESFKLQDSLRRRARVGLAIDRLLITRMTLWGVGMGSVGIAHLAVISSEAWNSAIGPTAFDAPIIGIAGLTCALSLWLAFFTPRAWQARLRATPRPDPIGGS